MPPVLPFVVHHGKKAWRVPRSVRALVGLDGMPADVSTFVRALQPELLFLLDLPRGRTVLFALTSWFLERAPKADEVLRTVIARIHDSTTRKTMKSALDKLLERGELQGQRALLRSQLTTRFGAIPDEIEARLAGASADDLLAWATRILTARSLAEVFAPD